MKLINYYEFMTASLVLGTVWVLAASVLLGPAGRYAAAALAVAGGALWALADTPWRAVLILALILHAAAAVFAHITRPRRRLLITGGVSAAAASWIAGLGGSIGWPQVLGPMAAGLLIAAAATAGLRLGRGTGREGPIEAWSPSPPRIPVRDAVPSRAEASWWTAPVFAPAPPADPATQDSSSGPAFDGHLPPADLAEAPTSRPRPRIPPPARSPAVTPPEPVDAPAPPGPQRPRARVDVSPPHDAPRASRPEPELMRPEPVTMRVSAHLGGSVEVAGIGWWAPPGHVRVSRSTTVVDGDDCTVELGTHYHVRRLEMPLDDFTAGPLRSALRDLLEGGSVAAFQDRVGSALPPRPDSVPQADLQVAPRHSLTVVGCEYVQMGAGSSMRVGRHLYVEHSTVPILELLAERAGFVEAFAAAVREPEPGPATAEFLRQAMTLSGRVDDLSLVRGMAGQRQDASLLHLFGWARVAGAAVVAIGDGNRLRQVLRVDRPGLRLDALRDAVAVARFSPSRQVDAAPSPGTTARNQERAAPYSYPSFGR